jgi:glycosyltransferase involved in cell wall biosynthesis
MASVLASSDACVAILKPLEMYKTTLPNKVFDYMACSKPVILAIDGVIRNIVEEAHAGIFSPPGNSTTLSEAVVYLYNHQEEGNLMGKSGRKYVESNFNRKLIADKFIKVLEDLNRVKNI